MASEDIEIGSSVAVGGVGHRLLSIRRLGSELRKGGVDF